LKILHLNKKKQSDNVLDIDFSMMLLMIWNISRLFEESSPFDGIDQAKSFNYLSISDLGILIL